MEAQKTQKREIKPRTYFAFRCPLCHSLQMIIYVDKKFKKIPIAYEETNDKYAPFTLFRKFSKLAVPIRLKKLTINEKEITPALRIVILATEPPKKQKILEYLEKPEEEIKKKAKEILQNIIKQLEASDYDD